MMAGASTSLGEASARIQATDLERRKTPPVRTALPGLRVEPKWLPRPRISVGDTPCSAEALTRGVPVRMSCPRVLPRCVLQRDARVRPGRQEVRNNQMSTGDRPLPYPGSMVFPLGGGLVASFAA